MLRSTALIALLVSARALVAADPALPEYVPPDTRVLIGVQVRTIMDSDWGKAVIEQVKSTFGDAWLKQAPFKGFDPLKDLDELWLAGSSMDSGAPLLAILRGRFDKSRLPAAIGRYHAVPLIPVDDRREQLLALVDEFTILAGDRFVVERAIDRHGLRTADSHLAAAVPELRARYWIWAVGEHLDLVSAPKSATQGSPGVESFEFGLALTHDLEMAAQIHMRSAEDARKMLATMGLLQTMAKNQQGSSQTKLESRVTDKTLDVSLRVPEEDLKQAWEQQRATIAQRLSQLPQQIAAARSGKGLGAFAGPPTAKAPAPPAKPRAPASKIVNDEDGITVQLTLPGGR
ncbi:MAG: hypothetical protein WBL61_09095 [Bryobacteraceae bacterium]